ncbi:MAG TPA: GAF domain-containing protein [Roseiflexaceae bacterium]|nr:GAF domain-containing protein [Roseiflexaceae bacterium]
MNGTEALLTLREAAALLGCSEATVRRLVRRGQLPTARVGRSLGFARADLEAHRRHTHPDGAAALLTRLQLISGVFTQLHSPTEAAELVLAQCVRALGASGGLLSLLDEGDTLNLVHTLGYDSQAIGVWQHIPLEADLPPAEVVRTGEALFFETPGALLMRYSRLNGVAMANAAWAVVPLPLDDAPIGAMVLSFAQPRPFLLDDRIFLVALAQQCAQAIARARLYAAERDARLASEAARGHATLLAETARVFGEARLDLPLLLDRVAEHIATILGDNCTIRLLSDDGLRLEPVAVFHPLPEARDLLRRLAACEPYLVGDGLTGRVFQSGQPLLLPRTASEELRPLLKPVYLAYVDQVGISSLLLVLLRVHGKPIGTLFMSRDLGGQPYTPADQALLQELADRAAVAIDNARLYVAEQQARTAAERAALRATVLQTIAAALASPHTPEQIADIVMLDGMRAIAATAGALSLIGDDGNFLLVRMIGYPPEVQDHWVGRRYPTSMRSPIADAVRTRAPVLLETPEAVAAAYPHLRAQLGPEHSGAWASVPLMVERQVFGGFTFLFAEPRSFSADDRSFLLALGQQCAQAIERARLHAAEQRARAELDAARTRQSLLATASVELASSLDIQTTLDTLAHLVIPRLADWCVVDMLADDGRIETAVLAHSDPTKEAIAWEMLRRFPISPDAPGGTAGVLRTLRPELLPEIDEAALELLGLDPDHRAMLGALGLRSSLCVPLIARGRALGTIALVMAESGRRFGPDDVPLIEDLARRAGLAVDNARLYRASQEAVQVRDTFFSVAAHELKTPLTSLLGQAQLMQRRTLREASLCERDSRSLAVVIEQAQRLNAMILAMLDSSRLEQGRLSIDPQPLDLGALVQRIAEETRPMLDRHSINVEECDRPLVVIGDGLRLEQVLQNLIGNAIKYSPSGGPVTVRLERSGDHARVSVSDRGIGIPAAAIPQLFQRFYRANNADSFHISGMGIGLYVVREIVTLHGGDLAVESREGQGSTFRFSLPLAPPSDPPERSPERGVLSVEF